MLKEILEGMFRGLSICTVKIGNVYAQAMYGKKLGGSDDEISIAYCGDMMCDKPAKKVEIENKEEFEEAFKMNVLNFIPQDISQKTKSDNELLKALSKYNAQDVSYKLGNIADLKLK